MVVVIPVDIEYCPKCSPGENSIQGVNLPDFYVCNVCSYQWMPMDPLGGTHRDMEHKTREELLELVDFYLFQIRRQQEKIQELEGRIKGMAIHIRKK